MREVALHLLVIACLVALTQGQRIRGRIRSSTFRRDTTVIEPGAATLAFVFDVTGSMWDDLKQVRAGAKKILQTTINRQEKPLHDYVLVPFHDPVVGPITVTSNGTIFQHQLKQLFVQGGGDCPEMSLTAIGEALEISLPSSFIYVFTDASAKDYSKLNAVLRIIQRKQSQVVFVLTGDCNNRNAPGYRAYEKIAATSSGQVFHITKSDVADVIKFIEVSVQAHKVVLLAADHDRGGDKTWEIPFDPELKEVTISLSGPNRRLRIYDPSGHLVTSVDGLETLLALESVLILNIKNATAGNWRISAFSSGEHSLRVTGLSILDFQTRFSPIQTLDWDNADYQPLEGADTYVLLNATGLPPPGEFREISLRDISGVDIQRIRLGPPPDPDNPYLYAVTPFPTPDVDFYIYVHGVTHDNFPFQRATKNAILNVIPVAPSVFMKPTHPGYFDYPAELPCQVSSLIPFHVTWSRLLDGRWIPTGSRTYHYQTSTVYLNIPQITDDSEGRYRCVANNSKGIDYGETFLDVEERPPTITVDGNVTVAPGRHVILTCHVKSKIRYRMSWRRVDGLRWDRSRIRMLSNNALSISRARPEDEAGYRCIAVNRGGSTDEQIFVTLQAAPQVDVRPRNPVEYHTGDTVSLRCSAGGYPEPTILWLNGTQSIQEDRTVKLRRSGTELRFVRAQQEHEGIYTCQATNKAGTAIDTGRLIYTEAPTAAFDEELRLILEGQATDLECRVTGVPRGTITWFLDGNQIANGKRHTISGDGSVLSISSVRTNDAGVYTCQVVNTVDRDSAQMTLKVGTIPVIVLPPTDTGIDISTAGSLPCSAVGYPVPDITWSRHVEMEEEDGEDGFILGVFELVIDQKEGRMRHDPRSNSLNIKRMEMEDTGVYTCTATNQFGSDMKSATIDVTGLVQPRITITDATPHVILGESIELPCRITAGNPTPSRVWNRLNQQFAPTGRVAINREGSVVITSAQVSDAGQYLCVATNVAGKFRGNIDLDVWTPPTISTRETDYTTVEENAISLICDVTGNPAPTVEWTKVGVRGPLRYIPEYRVLSDHRLLINNPKQEHSGDYRCTATNPAGRTSVGASLVVFYKPRKKDGSLDVYIVIQGNSKTLECPVTESNPPPTFTWQFNGVEVVHRTGQYEMSDDGTLKIFSAVTSDDGEYTCTAVNKAGSVSHKMSLVVHVPPRILRGPSTIRGLEGEDIGLKCEATGIPLPTVRWTVRDVEVVTRGRFTVETTQTEYSTANEIEIRPAWLQDDAEFVCTAINVAGRAKASTDLDVQRRPTIRDNDFGRDLTPSKGSHVTIPCVAHGDPNPTIRWYHDDREITGDELDVDIASNGSLILYTVDNQDSGMYKCEAANPLGKVDVETRVTVYEPPEITGEDDVTKFWVFEGNPATMYCYATAVPKPTITWYKVENTGDRVLGDERGHIDILLDGDVFNITRSRVSDTGRYYCAATNVEGTSNKHYELDVYVLPSIDGSDDIDRSRVILGDDFTLECPASGIPFPNIRWFKGLQEIFPEDEGMLIDNRGQRLRVLDSELEHDGDYTCVADNAVGETSKEFDVDILVPPKIAGDDMEHRIQVTRYLAIECRASGIPTPTLSWYKDGRAVAITGDDLGEGPRTLENGRYLEFETMRVEDEGVYTCEAVNEAGKDSKTHSVDVLVPPKLGDEDVPANVSVREGDDVTLSCYASGDPPPTIQWLKSGVPITTGGRFTISESGNLLSIFGAQRSDKGQYTCRATNDVGVVTQNQYLDVLVKPDIGGPNEETVVIQKGDRVALDCVISGNPRPSIRWEKNGLPVVANDKITFDFDNQRLIITDADESDTADYTCTASNIVGSDVKAFRLDVHVPPRIVPFTEDVYDVIESENFQIACIATGIPKPTITWLRDGQAVAKSSYFKYRDNGKMLVVLNANVDIHEGMFTCQATNEAGEDEDDVGISVLIPPSIYGQERITDKVVKEGRQVELECRVREGKPTPEIRWYYGERENIPSLSTVWNSDIVRQTLTNLRARIDSTGEYWCEAVNIAGRARKNFTIDVQVKPFIEGGETENKNVILHNDISFSCEVSGVPPPTVVWTKNGSPISDQQRRKYRQSYDGEGTFHLEVLGAEEDDQDIYSCVATNDAGQDSKDFDLDVYLPPTHDGDGVQNVTVQEDDDVILLCAVEAFPRPTIRWYKDGRPVVIPKDVLDSLEDYRMLPIPRAQISDAGLYKCEAENVAGITERNFRLNVHSKPKVIGPPVDEIIKLVGDQVDMICDIRGVPAPTLSWTKNGRPLAIDDDKMVLLQGSKILRIFQAELGDTGQFECHGVNVAGRAVKSFDVTIHESSTILGRPHETHDVNKGDDFLLECVVTGTPRPTITWLKDGVPVFDNRRTRITDEGRFLKVSGAVESDAARYICNASNVEAYDVKAYTVNVRVPPTIEDGPDKLWVKEGQNINLTCNARSNSLVNIQWLFEDIPITPSNRVRPSPQGKRLMLFNVQPEKAGKYTCRASNAAGSAEKDTQLDVYTVPTITDSDITDIYNVTQTQSVTLECDVSGIPDPTIEWLKDFYPIYFHEDGSAQRGNYEIQDGGRLFTLFNAAVHDEGTYKCQATNRAGFASKDYKVNVFVPPEIYRDGLREEIVAREKSFVRIQCAASGLPTPLISWLKDGEAFEPSGSVSVTNHFDDHRSFLAFQRIEEEDSGTYSCVAENPAGRDVYDMDIIVNVPPKIRGSENPFPTPVEVVVGETLDLECEVVRGTPKPTIEWWKRSRKIFAGERVKILGEGRYLRIPQARRDDYGIYTCVAKNNEGADSKEFNVQTLEPPRFDDDDQDEFDVVMGFSHFITCDIDAHPQPRLEWFKDGEPLRADNNVQVAQNGRVLFIRSARIQDGGIYMCRAINKAGSDDKTSKINILTPPLIADAGNDNEVDVKLDEPTFLNCTVQGYPQPTITWFRNGIQVDLDDENFETFDDGQILSIGSARLIDSGRYDCHARNTAGRDRKDFRLNVQVAPTISGPEFEDFIMLEGRYYELDCFSSGIPDPKNEWFKDASPVTPGQRYSQYRKGRTLGIYGADERDNGLFRCEATNVAGIASKTFNVTVHMSPKLDGSKYKNLIVNQGEDITLNCESETYPKPNVVWIKNGEELPRARFDERLEERVQITRDGFHLKLFDTHPEDAAQYSCQLSNDAGATSRKFNLVVNRPPEIAGPDREEIRKPIDSTLSMDCSAQGSPTPEIMWLKNGYAVEFSERVYTLPGQNTLRIDRSVEDDIGLYTCVAKNVAGDDSKDFEVDILVPPFLDKFLGPDNIDAILGDEVSMACVLAAGNPVAVVEWFKGGQPVTEEDAQIVEQGQLLIIPRAKVVDAGEYTCIAKNEIGQDDRTFNLNVLVPPSIGFGGYPNHVEVNETFDAVLHCNVLGGEPAPEITWSHNDVPLQMTQKVRTFADGKRLEIYRALTSDTGDYKCTATNIAGTVMDSVRLDVYVPPRFERPDPEHITLIEGEPLHMDCVVSGVPTPELAWTVSEDGQTSQPLIEGRVRYYNDEQSARIDETVLEDTGLYSCIATSISGRAQKVFNVTVMVPPQITGPQDGQIRVIEGNGFDLNCPVTGVPMPEVTWLKNGRPLPSVDVLRILNNGQQLHIESSRLIDIGTYTCVAKSDAGQDSRNSDVDVIVPPSSGDDDRNITAVVGSDVQLECNSDAVPPPTFSWLKEGREIGYYGHLLLLKSVVLSDTGLYTCEATNDAGKSVQNTRLTVFKKPTIAPGPKNVVALVRETVKFMCIVDGVPTPEVSWWKDSKELSPESGRQYRFIGTALEVRELELSDGGEYMCLATNDAGSAQRKIALEVQDPPTIAGGPTNITAIANSPVTLSCEASGTPQPIVKWTKDSRLYYAPLKLGHRQEETGSVQISAVSVQDTGFYTCLVENDAGTAFRDINLFVQVPPSIADTESRRIVPPGSRLLIPCRASGVPTPTVQWTRDGIPAEQYVGVWVNARDNSLEIPSVGTIHEASYTCTAVNPAGQAQHTVQVGVRTAPTIANPERRVTALEGTTTTLPCEATGTPEPTITWKQGTRVIEMDERFDLDENGGLRISDAQVQDAAAYTCVAHNSAGTAYGHVKLDVYVLPQLDIDWGQNLVAIAGQPFEFPISSRGLPEPWILWSKDGVGIDGEDARFVLEEDGSLQIPIVQPEDAGIYNVTAVNDAGATSAVAQLDVIVPPDLRAVSSVITVVQGSQIPLDIVVAEGVPTPEITWTKDGNSVDMDDPRAKQLGHGSLVINNAASTDSGRYVATAINDAGRDSVEIQVIVQVPPTFTETPDDQKRQSGDDMTLRCAATGFPIPTITWKFNDKLIPGSKTSTDISGISTIFFENVRSQDAGSYLCQASNPAGIIAHMATVTVDSPPVFTGEHDPDVTARLGTTARIDCPVSSRPPPAITWSKGGKAIVSNDRYRILANGSLLIRRTEKDDAGDYKCVASNEAGSVDRTTKLVVELAPSFVIKPSDTTAPAGTNVILDCTATGVPKPTIQWRQHLRSLPRNGRFTVLRNNSLQISTVQLGDTGEYNCFATNDIGSRMAKAFLTVQVHGQFGDWRQYGACSVTCGTGVQTRIRYCNSPRPANGGKDCNGSSEDTKPCEQIPCPTNGGWGEYGEWESCSVSCGQGHEIRTRECNNPRPQNGGLPCAGEAAARRLCSNPKCPVNGRWSAWNAWQPCSTSCGDGVSLRTRSCNNPPPSAGGEQCQGSESSSRVCTMKDCPVDGSWADWGPHSICTVSCGGGTKKKMRTCSDPPASNGGELCSGSNVQVDNCNPDPCPVNGAWAEWATWSACSLTCGGGQRSRYRVCDQPRPRYGGKYCSGRDEQTQSCKLGPCPEDGGWTEWTEWTPCGVTCGPGARSRQRSCSNPPPRHDGTFCAGDATQNDQCTLQPCPDGPITATGVIFGNVNDIPIEGSDFFSQGIPTEDGRVKIVSVIKDVPTEIGNDMRNQVSILTPIYWTFAREIEGAYNGYTLTKAEFQRQVNVEFPSGEVVEMFHNAKGVDRSGNLAVDIQINGDIPMFPADIDLSMKDYVEDYVQSGLQSLSVYSDRFYTINDEIMLYTWNHAIQYEADKTMPYLVESLYGTDIVTEYNPETLELMFEIDVMIGQGYPSNECPYGFVIDESGKFCNDVDECVEDGPCSHECRNVIGTYICECPDGFHIGMDGDTCEDTDECEESVYECEAPFVCENTRGSYRCVRVCGPGLESTEDGQACEDINECETSGEKICEHICNNTYGSFRCSCRLGYQRVNETRCEDIDECARGACQGDITQCHNTDGGYYCTNSCPAGFYMNFETESCEDIDECADPELNRCEHKCENVDGSYRCFCHEGFIMDESTGTCGDLDECKRGSGPCQYGCLNEVGGYVCYCPEGYRLATNGHNCEDVDECLEGEAKCTGSNVMCANSLGDFRCISLSCPPSFRMKEGVCRRECQGGECRVKSVVKFNSTFLRVGVPENQDLLELAVSHAHTPDGRRIVHRDTRFWLLTPIYERAYRLFGLRVVDDQRAVIYTKTTITRQYIDWYRLRVRARSYDLDGIAQYETQFSLYINVAPNPFNV